MSWSRPVLTVGAIVCLLGLGWWPTAFDATSTTPAARDEIALPPPVSPVERPAAAPRPPRPEPPATSLVELWDALSSPLHNGDRRAPVSLAVAPGRTIRLFVERTIEKETGLWVMRGNTGNPLSAVAGARIGDTVALTVMDPITGDNFSVLPTSSGTRIVDLRDRPACTETRPNPKPGRSEAANYDRPPALYDDLTAPVGTRRITLAAYYAPSVGADLGRYGGLDGLRVMTETAVELMNVALSRAGANACVDLVGLSPLDFSDEDYNSINVLTHFSDALAAVRQGRQLRTPSDLSLGIFRHANTPVGFAWSPGEESIVLDDYLASSIVAHELGHGFGMNHERQIVPVSAQTHPFAYGFRVDTTNPRAMDLMSYGQGNCELLLYSGPENSFLGVPVGDAQNNNARLAREQFAAVSARHDADYDFTGANWLINESTRGAVGTGESVMIAGLIINGTDHRQVVIRGIGPNLQAYGVQNALANPTLRLMDSNGREMEFNDDWAQGPRVAELRNANLVPIDTHESAIVRTLAPGAYTVILAGANDGAGVGLVEVYGIDPESRTSLVQAGAKNRLWSDVTTDFNTYHAYVYRAGEFVTHSRYLAPRFNDANRTVQQMLVLWTEPTLGFEVTNLALPAVTTVGAHPRREQIKALAAFATDTMNVALIDFDPAAAPQGVTIDPFKNYPGIPRRESADVVPRDTIVHVYSVAPNQARTLPPAANLTNLSTRGIIGTGERSLIAGLVVRGQTPKTYIFRALGEGLRGYQINQPADRISVTIHGPNNFVEVHSATRPDEQDLLAAWNLTPPSPKDVAGFVTLEPGAYTLVVTAQSEVDVGIGLIEIYATP